MACMCCGVRSKQVLEEGTCDLVGTPSTSDMSSMAGGRLVEGTLRGRCCSIFCPLLWELWDISCEVPPYGDTGLAADGAVLQVSCCHIQGAFPDIVVCKMHQSSRADVLTERHRACRAASSPATSTRLSASQTPWRLAPSRSAGFATMELAPWAPCCLSHLLRGGIFANATLLAGRCAITLLSLTVPDWRHLCPYSWLVAKLFELVCAGQLCACSGA